MRDGLTVLLVAAPVLALSWVYGGSRAEPLAAVVPWVSLACWVGILALPQRRPGEAMRAVWRRMLLGLLRDPFLWTSLALLLLLMVPFFNVALCPGCDRAAIDAGADPYPPWRWLPFCVNSKEHMSVLNVLAPSLLAALGVRHALGRSGKRAFLELLVWNGAAMALLGFIQLIGGAQFPYWDEPLKPCHFFSVFGYPNMAGSFFVMNYASALGLWCLRMQGGEDESAGKVVVARAPFSHQLLRCHYPVVAVALSFFAVLATLSRAAISLMAIVTVVFFGYVLIRFLIASGARRVRRFMMLPAIGFVFILLFGVTFVYAPPEVEKEIATLDVFNVVDRLSGKGQYHTRVASAIMRDFPVFGVGGWGYRHFCIPYMEDHELSQLQKTGGANVHNDYLQFLAEHGIVGFCLLMACALLLIAPIARIWQHWARTTSYMARSNMSPQPSAAFSFPPPVFWTVMGCLAVLVHAFGDCPLRAGAVLAVFLSSIPAVEGHLPYIRPESKRARQESSRKPQRHAG